MPAPGQKLPYKMAEISARRFVQDAVPHSLGLLRNHKTNIEKSLALHDWEKIQREEINASRVIKELKNLLLEMEDLRERIRDEDIDKFDAVTNRARRDAIECIQEFVELKLRSPSKSSSSTRSSTQYDPVPDVIMVTEAGIPTLQSDFQLNVSQLRARENVLRECEELRQNVEDLQGMFYGLHGEVVEQSVGVEHVHDNVEEADVQLQEGATQLQKALKYKKAMYPLCGALLGSCVGGPVGMIAGKSFCFCHLIAVGGNSITHHIRFCFCLFTFCRSESRRNRSVRVWRVGLYRRHCAETQRGACGGGQ